MKKFLFIMLAVLVLGACCAPEANAKKKVRNRKARTTAVTPAKVESDVARYCDLVDDFVENWDEEIEIGYHGTMTQRDLPSAIYPLQKKIEGYKSSGKLTQDQLSRFESKKDAFTSRFEAPDR